MKYLSGEYQFRNEGQALVLQVEEIEYTHDSFGMGGRDKKNWRDAKTEDLLRIQFCRNDKISCESEREYIEPK